MLPEMDRERLLHIKEAAQKINNFVSGLTEEKFLHSDLVQHAVINCLFIIGEAASRITQVTHDRFPEVEWEVIRGMRNRLAHAYFNINLSLVWYSATFDTPRLLNSVEQILASEL